MYYRGTRHWLYDQSNILTVITISVREIGVSMEPSSQSEMGEE